MGAGVSAYVSREICDRHSIEKDSEYEELIENICEAVLESVISYWLLGKALAEDFFEEDYIRLQEMFGKMDLETVKTGFGNMAAGFLKKSGKDDNGLLEYLKGALDNIAVRLKYAE